MKNVLADAAAAPAAPPANPQVRHPEEIAQQPNGDNPRPTKAPLASRSASPAGYATSGMEAAMGKHADKLHPVGKRR